MRTLVRFPATLAFAGLVGLVAAAGCSPGAGPRTAARSSAPGDTAVVPVTAARIAAMAAAPGANATLVNVWATWCGPCREEFPALVAAARRHPDVRLLLVSADFDDQLPGVKSFLASNGVTDTTWIKAEGDQEFINGLDAEWSGALPATVVYDSRGRKVAFWEGAADSARFEAAIGKALGSSVTKGAIP